MSKIDLSQSILEKIKTKHIMPKPRWTFLLHDYLVWAMAALSIIIGSLSVAGIIFMIRHNDWEMREHITDSLFGFILVTLPYFWIGLLGLFIFLSYYNFRHTRQGYRHRFSVIMVGSVIISVILGGVLYQTGVGQVVDNQLGANLPFYRNVIYPRINLWSQAEQGRLAGVILEVKDINTFFLLDPDEFVWQVTAQRATITPRIILRSGERIRMIGQKESLGYFIAELIMPFGPPGKGFFDERVRHREFMSPLPGPRQLMPGQAPFVACPSSGSGEQATSCTPHNNPPGN
jgi:hypothetical protein